MRVRKDREYSGRKQVTVEYARDTIAKLSRSKERGQAKNEDRVARSRNEDRVARRQSVEQAAHIHQRWQPLEDGRCDRVVGQEGAEF